MRFKKLYVGISLFLFLLTGLTAHAFIRTVTGTVTKVSDGDKIHVTTPEQTKLRIRL
jgi:endonuclease YncB( thermonuclease family)